MKRSTRNTAEGRLHEVKGAMKQQTGKLLKDPELEADGLVEKAAGKLQKAAGKIGKAVGR